jgi:glucokinase
VGVAVPGFLDGSRRRVVHLSNLPALDGFPLARRLEEKIGSPVVLDADSNAGAVGEARLGAGRGASRVLYLTLGTGLGAALVEDGAPVRASHHTIGQVAHLPSLSGEPFSCRCGQRGCCESVLSAAGIRERARKEGLDLEPLDLARAARRGIPEARQVWAITGGLLGELVRFLAAFLSPEVVVVGGGIAGAARFFLPVACGYLRRTLPQHLRGKVRIRPARLQPWAGAAGAALLALDAAR